MGVPSWLRVCVCTQERKGYLLKTASQYESTHLQQPHSKVFYVSCSALECIVPNPLPIYIFVCKSPSIPPFPHPQGLHVLDIMNAPIRPPVSHQRKMKERKGFVTTSEWSLTKICQMEYPLVKPRTTSKGSTGPSPTREWCSIEMSV